MSTQSVMLKGRDTDGGSHSYARLDRYMGLLGTASMGQLAVSLGRYYGTGTFQSAVAAAGTIDILVRTPAASVSEAVSLAGIVASGADALLEVFEAPTASADGTALPALQVNRTSANVSQTLAFLTPTLSNDGTLIFRLFIPGGKGGNSVGGVSSDFQRLHCAPETDYLVRVTNRGNGPGPIGVNLNWVELPA